MNSTRGTEFPVTEGIGTEARHTLYKDITEKFLAEDTGFFFKVEISLI